MKFCPEDKCKWYSNPERYGRKCYYGAQCWKGWLDMLIYLIRRRFNGSKGRI